jgi:hypothetical protein
LCGFRFARREVEDDLPVGGSRTLPSHRGIVNTIHGRPEIDTRI